MFMLREGKAHDTCFYLMTFLWRPKLPCGRRITSLLNLLVLCTLACILIVSELYRFISAASLSGATVIDVTQQEQTEEFCFRLLLRNNTGRQLLVILTLTREEYLCVCPTKSSKEEWVTNLRDTVSILKKNEETVKSKLRESQSDIKIQSQGEAQ